MATVEERVKAVTARVLGFDPEEIQPESSFTEDLGAESRAALAELVQPVHLQVFSTPT
jgi:acyl carrier protein